MSENEATLAPGAEAALALSLEAALALGAEASFPLGAEAALPLGGCDDTLENRAAAIGPSAQGLQECVTQCAIG